jgi:hypothetical protein
MAVPLGDKGSTLDPFLFVQKNTERELRAQLYAASKDIGSAIRRLEGADGIGAQARVAQFKIVQAEIAATQKALWDGIGSTVSVGKMRAIDAAADSVAKLESIYLKTPGIPVPPGFEDAARASARQGATNVMSRSTNGIRLSERVYGQQNLATGRVSQMIDSGLIAGKSAREIAKDAMGFISPSTPGGASYAAMRLGRTELNNAFHTTAVKQWGSSPFVEAMKWNTSGSHTVSDECDALNGQIFKKSEVPGKPHPQCFCYITAEAIDEDEMVRRYATGEFDAYLEERSTAGLSRFPETDRQHAAALTQRRVYQGGAGPLGGLPRARSISELDPAQRAAYLTAPERALIKRMQTPAGVGVKSGARAAVKATMKVVPEVAPFLQKLAEVKARMPSDKSMIGKRHTKGMTGAENKADRIRGIEAKAGNKPTAANIAAEEKKLIPFQKAFDEADRLRNDIWSLRKVKPADYPAEIVARLERANLIGFKADHGKLYDAAQNRYMAAKNALSDRQMIVGELKSARRTIEGIKSQPEWPSVPGKTVNDINPVTGRLGADTQIALDAIIDAGKIIDDEVIERMVLKHGARPEPLFAREAGTPYVAYYNQQELVRKATLAWDTAERKMVLEVLKDVRKLGGPKSNYLTWDVNAATEKSLRSRMDKAVARYPEEWNRLNVAKHPTVKLLDVDRGYNEGGRVIALSGKSQHVATHELGHSMEGVVPGLKGSEWAMVYSRSMVADSQGVMKLRSAEVIYPGNPALIDEVGHRDHWPSAYSGKDYATARGGLAADNSWEVFTTGIESLMDASPYFGRTEIDVQFRRYMMGVLSVL